MLRELTVSFGVKYEKVIFNRRYHGSGKTTVSQTLKMQLENSVFLDGDWCWDAHPFK